MNQLKDVLLFLWRFGPNIQIPLAPDSLPPPHYNCYYRGGAISPSSPNNSNLKPSEPSSSSSSSSHSCHFFWWSEIVYLGQIVSYLREKKRGRLPPRPSLFPNPHPPSLSFPLYFFHPQPLHFGFQPFNQSATIRADRATGNNRGGVTGGVTSQGWGVGIEGRPRQKTATPVECPAWLFVAVGQWENGDTLTLLCIHLSPATPPLSSPSLSPSHLLPSHSFLVPLCAIAQRGGPAGAESDKVSDGPLFLPFFPFVFPFSSTVSVTAWHSGLWLTGGVEVYACVRVCLRVQEGAKWVCVCVHVCLDALGVGGGVVRPKLGGRGRRVDGRMGESRGRSVRVREEERGWQWDVVWGWGWGWGASSTHSLTLSVTVWRFHT